MSLPDDFRCGVCDACDDDESESCAVVVLERERDDLRAQLAESQAAVADWEKWCRAAEAKLAAAQAENADLIERHRELAKAKITLSMEVVELRRVAGAVVAAWQESCFDSTNEQSELAHEATVDQLEAALASISAGAPLLDAVKLAAEALRNFGPVYYPGKDGHTEAEEDQRREALTALAPWVPK